MLWRLLLIPFALTFLIGGAAILSDDDCKYVDLGGNRRVMSYTCHSTGEAEASYRSDAPDRDLPGGVAGGLGLAIGSGMILLAVWPLIARFSESPSTARSRKLRDDYLLSKLKKEMNPSPTPRPPSPAPSHVPTPQVDAVPIAKPEPAAREPEIVESPEVAEESPARRAGPKEKKEPMVDDDPELLRLQEALAAAEQKIEQRLEEQRRAEEDENRKAETAKRISELASRLEVAEAKLTELDALGSPLETTKALQKRCKCSTLVDVSRASCPNCMTNTFNQAASVWRCQRCEHVVGEDDDSCVNCRAVFQE